MYVYMFMYVRPQSKGIALPFNTTCINSVRCYITSSHLTYKKIYSVCILSCFHTYTCESMCHWS